MFVKIVSSRAASQSVAWVMGARAARVVGARGYKNYVFSDTLRRLERECNRVCAVPVPRMQKVSKDWFIFGYLN